MMWLKKNEKEEEEGILFIVTRNNIKLQASVRVLHTFAHGLKKETNKK